MSKPPTALEDRDEEDGRLFSPSAGRNKAVIAAVLSEILPQKASVLEVGSGTGEHGIAVLTSRPDVQWQFSDPDPSSRASQNAWGKYSGFDMAPSLNLDMTDANSRAQITRSYEVIFSANMIHIAPVSALEGLAELASKAISDGGQACLYGPFLFGEDSAPSNLEFDASLKRRNPQWGVREIEFVKHIFGKHSFNASSLRDMPKNNFLLGMLKD